MKRIISITYDVVNNNRLSVVYYLFFEIHISGSVVWVVSVHVYYFNPTLRADEVCVATKCVFVSAESCKSTRTLCSMSSRLPSRPVADALHDDISRDFVYTSSYLVIKPLINRHVQRSSVVVEQG